MAAFISVHDQPVTLDALKELEPEILTAEVTRLQNSVKHLRRSNDELKAFCEGGEEEQVDDETKAEFEQSMRENDETIASQEERMLMLRLALESQLGVDAANSHYTLAGTQPVGGSAPDRAAAARGARSAPNAITEVDDTAEADGGLYL